MEKRIIEVCCYNKIEQWRDRKLAEDFYFQGAMECDGAERDRYLDIYSQLHYGSFECCDDSQDTFKMCKLAGRYSKFPNGTSIRDLFGEIEFPIS